MTDPERNLILLSTYEAPGLRCRNRVVMAPMTRNRAGVERTANELMARYYAQRSTAGLMITESVDVSPGAVGYPGTPGLYTRAQVEGFRQLVAHVRAARPQPGPFFCQLFHTGRVSHVSFQPDGAAPVAPSAIAADAQLYTSEGMQPASMPRALDPGEIAEVVREYVRAARGAIEAGFDGVEINAGNGYLIDQFLNDGTNQRTDRYGGSVENRIRFLSEIVDAVGAAVGSARVAVRVSPINENFGGRDSDPAHLFTTLAGALDGRGLAYLHVIEAADRATITPRMRERFRGTLVVNDGYDRERAERALQEGAADLVSFARLFLANPDLPRRFASSAPLNEPDPATFYGGTDVGYTSYPALDDVGAGE
jgi:N-ethylmaleimide reductase